MIEGNTVRERQLRLVENGINASAEAALLDLRIQKLWENVDNLEYSCEDVAHRLAEASANGMDQTELQAESDALERRLHEVRADLNTLTDRFNKLVS